ncbi:MAG TPA: VOC family protein, partial [Streptosporangiaceae bacterium]|nr:VOC family protein [Streptosporangiaceae bacterium]
SKGEGLPSRSLGATRIDIGQRGVSWLVMADPDGHELCVLTPR